MIPMRANSNASLCIISQAGHNIEAARELPTHQRYLWPIRYWLSSQQSGVFLYRILWTAEPSRSPSLFSQIGSDGQWPYTPLKNTLLVQPGSSQAGAFESRINPLCLVAQLCQHSEQVKH